MGRASGRKNLPRAPQPGTPEGDDIGLSARQDPSGSPIPGLTGNIVNYPVVRQKPAAGQPGETFDEYRGMMAHGVPNDSETTNQRALHEQGPLLPDRKGEPELHRDRELPAPVPVYLTTLNAGGRPLGTISTAKITIPASTGSDPVRIASRDLDRTSMYLMVETAAGAAGAAPTGIRISRDIALLSAGFGALIRAGGATYQKLDNQQDELFALSNDGSACTLSVIYLYGETAAG